MTTEELVKLIVEFCSDKGCSESPLSEPNPEHYVYTFELLDFIHNTTRISKEKIGEWFEIAQRENRIKNND